MQADNSNIPSSKVYQSHSQGVILTSFFGFVIVGLVVAFLFMPIVAYFPAGEERVDMTGLNLIRYSLRLFIQGGYNPLFERFGQNVSNYNGQVAILGFVAQYAPTLDIVVMSFLLVSAMFAIMVAIYSLIFLLRGRMKSTVMISALSHSVVSSLAVFTSLLFLYFFLCRKMFIEINIMDHIRFYMTPFILIAIAFIVSLILSGIYKKCLKRRVYVGNYKPKAVVGSAVSDSPVQRYINNFPRGTNQIGDKAFEGNEGIEDATIPNGIVTLGNNAFASCPNLVSVSIPVSVTEIGSGCFMNTPKLKAINYKGTLEQWNAVNKGADYLKDSGAETLEASDGKLVLK